MKGIFMFNAKACIVFTVGLEKEVSPISTQLSAKGYNVCVAAADQEIVEAAQAGASCIPDAVKNCISDAEICVFLIPRQDAESVEIAAGFAGSMGKQIVAVAEDIDSLPQVFDDFAKSVVVVGSPKLGNALQGESVWERPTGSSDGKRIIHRVKCQ
jgi:hypothetical protein